MGWGGGGGRAENVTLFGTDVRTTDGRRKSPLSYMIYSFLCEKKKKTPPPPPKKKRRKKKKKRSNP